MTLYEELGVEPDATNEQIAQAHRRRVKQTHPDIGGDREEFEKVQRAAIVLRNPDKREKYDRTGETSDELNNDMTELTNTVTQAFDQAMSQPGWQHRDIIASAKAFLNSGREGLKSQIQAQEEYQDKIQSALKRLKFKGGKSGKIDLLTNVLCQRLASVKATLVLVETQDRMLITAIEFLKYYKWDYDEQTEPSPNFIGKHSFQDHQDRMRTIFSTPS